MPYLRNAWYVAALSSEVQDAPLARQLLDDNVVIFRAESGEIGVVLDKCPHRFAPLSRGKVRGEAIECGYHGLQFGRDGRCTLNPHGAKAIPNGADVRAYPAHERYGFIWFWPGDPAQADAATMPPYPFNEDPGQFAVVYGHLDVAGNYQLVVDNLLDLSHVEWLHPMFQQPGGVDAHRTEFFVEGSTVIANRWKPNVLVHGLHGMLWDKPSTHFDARSNMRWTAPATMSFDLGATDCGGDVEDGVKLPNAHLVTPASELQSHYFWSIARNRRIDDAQTGAKLQSIADRIFRTEDVPIIEAQQRNMGATSDLMSLKPISIEPDIPAMRARRILAELIREEQNGRRASAAE
jgi:vanillate O-demethylase monooxygenase subunit